ncbi:E3 ubiquitin-protein ligase, partial [Armadillidium nasatum]
MECSNHNFHELSLDNPITPKTSFLLDAVVNFVFEDYSNDIWNEEGRIGPSDVGFHKECAGSFEYKDGLEISSKDNFSTVYSDTCIYDGKWQYEVLLGSKGVMQIGWATINCTFSQENGVGDTRSSYAYDGNRQRKWNSSTSKYGELWSIGDVISSTIDLEKGEIAYYRNGRSMGIAFKNIPTGPGIAYFPAFSLAMDESLVVNFGGTPFCYPIHGFRSLQAPPEPQLHVAKMCFKWLDKLVLLS